LSSKGRLITLEGGDGAGKSTQSALLVSRLEAAGVVVVTTREPGGTPVGEELRRLVKGSADPSPRTELLMFEAARAELVQRVIRPAIERGATVVADRYTDSSLAYQGYGRGLDLDEIRSINAYATGGLAPDLTVLLDVAPPTGAVRSTGRDGEDSTQRRFEDAGDGFHDRVRRGYLELASLEPDRWIVLDGSMPSDQLAEQVWARVSNLVQA
jgi:dTMP kinase